MKKRVYCSDVDGTLARQGYYLTEDTLALVHEMVDADINFTIVTGRFLSRSLPVMQQLKLKVPAFCLSGALAYDCANERILKVWPIDPTVAKTVAERLQTLKHNVLAAVYHPNENRCKLCFNWVKNPQPFPMDNVNELGYLHDEIVTAENIIPLMEEGQCIFLDMAGDEGTMKTAYGLVRDIEGIKVFLHESPHNKGLWVLDIVAENSGKGNAIQWMKEYMGAEESVGFGDHYNDLPMLLAADIGVTMAEAPEDMKRAVDLVLPATPNCVPDYIMAKEGLR